MRTQTIPNRVENFKPFVVGNARPEERDDGPTAPGVDDVAWAKGHTYLTLLYDIGGPTKRLLAVAEERTEASPRSCPAGLGDPA